MSAATAMAATAVSVKSGSWSDSSLWSTNAVPQAGDLVVVSPGHAVIYDVTSSAVAGVSVSAGGQLLFDPQKTVTLESTGNVVVTGTLSMRPNAAVVSHTLRFTGIDETNFVGGGLVVLDTDVGLWVMAAGRLDAAGTPKTPWTHVSGNVAQGAASIVLEAAPAGWQVGDTIALAPTEAPSAGDPSWNGFDEATITSISGATVGLSSATTRTHPVTAGFWRAEVLNLTRNVRIEGTATGRSHIFLHTNGPQTISFIEVRFMGPRKDQDGDGYTDPVLGRYGVHFHENYDSSRGSLVDGVVVRDGGNHAFAPHASHGITLRDTIAYKTAEDAYWWDPPGSVEGKPDTFFESHNTLFEHAVAAQILTEPSFRGFRLNGFFLGKGNGNAVHDCVTVGIQGNKGASGFHWPESAADEWTFRNNLAHNNKVHGILVWQNNSLLHDIDGFVAYHNQLFGIQHGAYNNNRYHYRSTILFENGAGGVDQHAQTSSQGPERLSFQNLTVAGGQLAVMVGDHVLPSVIPVLYRDCGFEGQPGALVEVNETGYSGLYDFVRCGIEPTNIVLTLAKPGMRIRSQRADGSAFEMDSSGAVTVIPQFDFSSPVAAISPVSGPSAGGNAVIVTGTGFQTGAGVTVGGSAASSASAVSPIHVVARTPAHPPGTVADVVVTNPDASATTLTNGYVYDYMDVPPAAPFHDSIIAIARNRITAGCGAGNYCPERSSTRAEMAVFLLKSKFGFDHVPPPATGGVFADVQEDDFAADWIEELASLGITGGCDATNYCPDAPVTRGQMAVFLLKTLLGSGYVPPPAAGIFEDVPADNFAINWIEDLYNRQITGGCLADPLRYCPDAPNTRGQMAVFLVKTFTLQ